MIGKNINRFDIVILDADKLIRKHKVDNLEEGCKVKYFVDYTRSYDRRWFTKNVNSVEDNALLFQIRDILHIKVEENSRKDRKVLKKVIVYVDFSSFFGRIEDIKDSKPIDGAYKKEELEKTGDLKFDEYKIRQIISNGVYIRFENEPNEGELFVPVDKSSSMSKDCVLAFVKSDIKEKLEKRLNLNMDFSKIPVQLSKYYAYRGLYLTDAQRVDDIQIVLDCNRVVVIDDWSHTVPKSLIVTGDKSNKFKRLETVKDKKIKELFDGEGIISPEYADAIDNGLGLFDQYKDGSIRKAQSFQIRLPFAKGMLHTVDFKRFIREYAEDKDEFIIIDAFGYSRDLYKADIIMPVSMLKCKKWIEEFLKKLGKDEKEKLYHIEIQNKKKSEEIVESVNEIDPMWYYFYQIKECNHSLYIANTDLSYSRIPKVRLGYQFLNTLKIDGDTLDIYTKQTKEYVENPFQYLCCIDELNEEETEKYRKEKNIWKVALKKNPALLNDSKIKRELQNIRYFIKQEYAYGRFLVNGEVRLLSRDLFEFLIQLLRMENGNNPLIKDLEKKRMYEDNFYMPNALSKIKAYNKDSGNNKEYCYYGILRNPHLSRYEQCALTPYWKNKDIYDMYFGHLKGVLMVAYNSLDPVALGGADFDGDIVKFIYDDNINNAILSTNYEKKGGKGKKEVYYKRVAPVIEIPSLESESNPVPQTSSLKYYQLIRDTFANKIGIISNRAIAIGRKQYWENSYNGPTCEECTILTGLEIDAAKTGVHPDLAIIKDEEKSQGYIADFKTEFDRNFVGKYNSKISKTNIVKEDNFYRIKKYKDDKDYIIEYPVQTEEYVLGKIPIQFFEMIMTKSPSFKSKEEQKAFIFLEDENWKTEIDENDKKVVEAIIMAYKNVLSINRSLNKWNERRNNRKTFGGHTHNTLNWQYDSEEFEKKWLSLDDIMVNLDELFQSESEVVEAINRLKELGWVYKLPEEKESALNNILQRESHRGLPEIVGNFGEKGYKLLYYILQDLRSMKIDQESDVDYIDNKRIEFSLKELSEVYDKKTYDKYENLFYGEYKDMISEEDTGISNSLVEDVLDIIDEFLVEKDDLYKLKLMYSLTENVDKKREIFWLYFKPAMLKYVRGQNAK